MKLHRGLFWYYFDANRETPPVREEYAYPCSPIWRAGRERGFLFRLTYYHKRVNLEVFHALSRRHGDREIFADNPHVLFQYSRRQRASAGVYKRILRPCGEGSDEDSFARNSGMSGAPDRKKKEREPEACPYTGLQVRRHEARGSDRELPTEKMLALAHEKDATMSEYMCALLIWSIMNTSYRRSMLNRPVVVSLPVNLRNMFGSTTMRNFFGHVSIGVRPRRGMTFDEVLSEVKERFDSCLTREYFERQIDANVGIEKIGPVKFVPVWIKDLVMRILFAQAEKRYTITFSNLG